MRPTTVKLRIALLARAAAVIPTAQAAFPPFVTRGMQLTYYSASASIAGSADEWVPDEDGNFVDKVSGRRYRIEPS